MGQASVIIDQYLIVIGGKSDFIFSSVANMVIFDMKTGTCAQVEISGRKPGPLSKHSACYWKNNQIIVYGGESEFGGDITEVGIITLSFTEGIIFESFFFLNNFDDRFFEGRMEDC